MRILAIQHKAIDHLGLVADLAPDGEVIAHSSVTHPVLPPLDSFDGLVVMGGPQAAFSDDGFPARQAELDMIRCAVATGVPVLGICLGAQLLAVAMGGSGYSLRSRGRLSERGYMPVHLTPEGVRDELFAGCPEQFSPRQFHDDSFGMPPGALRLATSKACEEQGFRLIGRPAWGLQFHFEMKLSDPSVHLAARSIEDSAPQPSELDAGAIAAIELLEPIARNIFANFADAVRSAMSSKVTSMA